jgi:C-terminal processing protease CtpA/Prc
MKIRKFLAVGTLAALSTGLVAIAASAQDRNSDCGKVSAEIARQVIRAQVRQAIQSQIQGQIQARVQAQIARTIAENVSSSVTTAVTNEVAARVNAQVRAALANSLSLQGRAYYAAQNPTPRPVPAPAAPRALIGDEFNLLDETGWLGVTPEDVSADRAKELKLASPRGVYLSEVEKDSPAEKAGLKSGDVIMEFNGEHVESVVQFRRLVRETPSGRTVSIAVWREGHSQTISATMGSPAGQFNIQLFDGDGGNLVRNFTYNGPNQELLVPPAPPRAYSFAMPDMEGWGFGQGEGNNSFVFRNSPTPTLGISAETVNGQLGSYFGAPDGEGVLVREVNSGTPAEKAGMKAGDVIIKIDGDRVKTVNEMQSRLREKRDAKTVQVTVTRRGTETTLTVEPTKPATRPATPRVNTRPISF